MAFPLFRSAALRAAFATVVALQAPPSAWTQFRIVAPGVVIETVDVGTAPYRTGLRSGDVLLSWKRTSTAHPGGRPSGTFASPFDLRLFELEEAYRGTHVLTVERGGETLSMVNSQGPWTDITVRPRFVGEALAEFERGLADVGQSCGGRPLDAGLVQGQLKVNGVAVRRRDWDGGLRTWEQLASHLSGVGEHAAAAWMHWRIAWEYLNVVQAGEEPRVDDAEAALQTAVEALQPLGNDQYVADLHARFGHELVRVSQVDRAGPALERAVASTERAMPASPTLASVLEEYAVVRSILAEHIADARTDSEPIWRRAMDLRARLTPSAPERALLLARFGDTWAAGFADQEGKRAAAEAWRLILEAAPQTLEAVTVAEAYREWAYLHGDHAELELINEHVVRAEERWRPDARGLTRALAHHAGSLALRGRLDAAEAVARRSLAHARRMDAVWRAGGFTRGLIDAIDPLTMLGDIAQARGDLAAAEEWYQQAIALLRRRFPDRVGPPAALLGLGRVFIARGDVPRAVDLYARIGRRPADFTVSAILRLGEIAVARGDLATAAAEADRAAGVIESMRPGSLEQAQLLQLRAAIAVARSDLNDAEQTYRAALEVVSREARGTIHEAAALQLLGDVQIQLGRTRDAIDSYSRALAIRVRLAPGTASEAESRHGLARAYRSIGDSRAEAEIQLAIEALEHQVRRAGARDQARAGVAARGAQIYRDRIEWLLEQGRTADAFHVLERSRARSFLASLAERPVRFSVDVPPELAAERARAEAEYDQLQAAIAAVDPSRDAQRLQGLISQLHVAQTTLDVIANRIQAAAPRVAAARYPRPLDAAAAAAALDPGTTVLSYAVGTDWSTLFVLAAGIPHHVRSMTLPLPERQLKRDVEALRRLIAANRAGDLAELERRGRALYDRLLKPAEPYLGGARRLLIIGDGPLLALPFAALVRGTRDQRPEYLVGWKPLHTAISVTAYVQLRQAARLSAIPAGAVVAFGDPRYPAPPAPRRDAVRAFDAATPDGEATHEPAAGSKPALEPLNTHEDRAFDPEVRAETERGARLTTLPGSRDEVMTLARLYGPAARVYVGAEATEERATRIGREARLIHFAAHGLINDRLPLNSALALTIPRRPSAGSSNGLLQAWEIYDRMRLDADLVTLSACESALGREARGEGLFGLARAFLYAGARSVLASQWRVSDRSTAVLMERFYTELRAGRAKDEALRVAQLHLIASEASSHPYYWAAFQLHGSWR